MRHPSLQAPTSPPPGCAVPRLRSAVHERGEGGEARDAERVYPPLCSGEWARNTTALSVIPLVSIPERAAAAADDRTRRRFDPLPPPSPHVFPPPPWAPPAPRSIHGHQVAACIGLGGAVLVPAHRLHVRPAAAANPRAQGRPGPHPRAGSPRRRPRPRSSRVARPVGSRGRPGTVGRRAATADRAGWMVATFSPATARAVERDGSEIEAGARRGRRPFRPRRPGGTARAQGRPGRRSAGRAQSVSPAP